MKGNLIPPEQRKKYTKETIYLKEYHDCTNQNERDRRMADVASDNGRCWWIYRFIMANAQYRSNGDGYRR